MEEYDRIVEFVDPLEDETLYFYQEKGIFISRIPNRFVQLNKYIPFLGPFILEKRRRTIYPTGYCYMLCDTEGSLILGKDGNLKPANGNLGDTLYQVITTPSVENSCLIYAIVLSHPRMNKDLNRKRPKYIKKLKRQFMEYCLSKFAKDIHKKDDVQIIALDIIKNSDIPQLLKNEDSVVGHYLEKIPDNDDFIFSKNLFEVCQNNLADISIIGGYAAEFFEINIVCYVKNENTNMTYKNEFIVDKSWDTIYIYLSQSHFSNICKIEKDGDKCSTENIIK